MSSTHETRATTARSGGGDVTTLPAIPAAALHSAHRPASNSGSAVSSSGNGASSCLASEDLSPRVAGARGSFCKIEFAALVQRIMEHGGCWRDVAEAAGCSPGAAKQRGNKLGFRSTGKRAYRRKWTREAVVKAAALALRIGTVPAAEKIGITPSGLRQVMRRNTRGLRALRSRFEE